MEVGGGQCRLGSLTGWGRQTSDRHVPIGINGLKLESKGRLLDVLTAVSNVGRESAISLLLLIHGLSRPGAARSHVALAVRVALSKSKIDSVGAFFPPLPARFSPRDARAAAYVRPMRSYAPTIARVGRARRRSPKRSSPMMAQLEDGRVVTMAEALAVDVAKALAEARAAGEPLNLTIVSVTGKRETVTLT
jgi:hypothetical protein